MYRCPPITKPIRSAEPTFEQEPIGIEEAKRQCGVANDVGHFDADFARWIVSARRQVEHDAQVVFCTGTFTYKLNEFPRCAEYLEIPCVRPVTAITSISYLDTSGASQTWSSIEYTLDASGQTPIVKLNYGYLWPVIQDVVNPVTITFVAGYASVYAMPSQYRDAVILKVRSSYKTAIGEDPKRDEEAYDRVIGFIGRESVG